MEDPDKKYQILFLETTFHDKCIALGDSQAVPV